MVLQTIISHKRAEVATRKQHLPVDELRRGLEPSRRSLKRSLSEGRTRFILELKKASPSRGIIRRDFIPADLAKIYEPHADGISVLADNRFFKGSLEYVREVSDNVKLPVLLKDFVLEPYQVFEARKWGADGILLMLSVLDDRQFRQGFEAAQQLEMDALVEVHDESELRRALELGAEIIGINNRNLANLKVDLSTTERLAPLVPREKIVISESGIGNHEDVLRLRNLVSGFLVGSSLMSRDDLGRATRELIYGAVKVCGLSREEDAAAVRSSGGIYGGLIFAEESPRTVTSDRAKHLASGVDLEWAGVFRNQDVQFVVETANELQLRVVQLHGEESEDYLRVIKRRLPKSTEIWKVVRVSESLPRISKTLADRVLLDTYRRGLPGGTGERFDWALLDGRERANIVLSGGLSPENAEEADRVGASVLDVNSGVESQPGIKDSLLIGSFFKKLRGRGRC